MTRRTALTRDGVRFRDSVIAGEARQRLFPLIEELNADHIPTSDLDCRSMAPAWGG